MFKKVKYILLTVMLLVGTLGTIQEAAQADGGGNTMEYAIPTDVLESMRSEPEPDYRTIQALQLPKVPRNANLWSNYADYSGKSGKGIGNLPDPDAAALIAQSVPQLDVDFDLTDAMQPYKKALLFTDYPLNSYAYSTYAYYPYIAIGRLLIYQGSSYVAWCTASVISNSVLVTAAHCVYDTQYDFWYDGWEFHPYAQGSSSLGGTSFLATNATIPTKFASARNWWKGRAYDVALILLDTYSGQTVNFYTGTLGWWYGGGTKQLQHSFGYPSNMADGGAGIWSCIGQSSSSGKYWMKIGCPMESGSSGGPWITWFDGMDNFYLGNSNYVTGVVSGGVPYSNISNGTNFVWNNFGILCDAWGFC